MGSRVTITDLAKELGLSVCTINKALTGKSRISEETRTRVIEAAERLGYKASAVARSMGRPVIKLAAIHPDAWPSHIEELFKGVRERLSELSDYRVEAGFKTTGSFSDAKAFLAAVKDIAKTGASGLIVSFGDFQEKDRLRIWDALNSSGIPHVILGSPADGAHGHLSCVWQDCRLCGRLAANLLSMSVPKGSRTAIFIGRKDHLDHHLKIEGFRKEAIRLGLPPPEICEAFDKPELAFPTAKRLFNSNADISGIYIGTENAQGILDFIGNDIGSDKVNVVATGTSKPIAEGFEKGLVQATIHQRQRVQGRLAVDTLFGFLDTGAKPEREILVAPQIMLPANFTTLN